MIFHDEDPLFHKDSSLTLFMLRDLNNSDVLACTDADAYIDQDDGAPIVPLNISYSSSPHLSMNPRTLVLLKEFAEMSASAGG